MAKGSGSRKADATKQAVGEGRADKMLDKAAVKKKPKKTKGAY